MEINITVTKDDGTQVAATHEHVPNALAFLTSLFPEGSAAHESAPAAQPASALEPTVTQPVSEPAAPAQQDAAAQAAEPAAAAPAPETS